MIAPLIAVAAFVLACGLLWLVDTWLDGRAWRLGNSEYIESPLWRTKR